MLMKKYVDSFQMHDNILTQILAQRSSFVVTGKFSKHLDRDFILFPENYGFDFLCVCRFEV